MRRQTVVVMCIFILAFVRLAVGKSPPSASTWAGFDKPAFSRSLAPAFAAPGISSITVPFGPKSSPFFPKFVDPKAMISKKTEMVTDLLNGLKPNDYSLQAAVDSSKPVTGSLKSVPIWYTPITNDYVDNMQELTGAEKIVGEDKAKRGVSGPQFGTAKLSSFPTFNSKSSAYIPSFGPAGFLDSSMNDQSFQFSPRFFDAGTSSLRRRREIIGSQDGNTQILKPRPTYPGLGLISEEPNSVESKFQEFYDSPSTPKEMLPGMFGPFGPFSPYTSVTEIPIPKSTIVPSDFWLPSSIIPGPTEYTEKVSGFLNKLLESLSNKTAPIGSGNDGAVLTRSLSKDSLQEKSITSRSVEDVKTISATKDFIVDSILSELGQLKAELINTLNDFIVYQKTACTKPSTKKSFKSPSPFAALFAPPAMDPTLPFTQRITALSQVFDMLTDLQKNITSTVQDAMKSSNDSLLSPSIPNEAGPANTNYFPTEDSETPNYPTANLNGGTTLRDAIISDVIKSPNTYFQDDTSTAKRDTRDEYQTVVNPNNARNQYKRLVKMNMHQGYQSMPLGTIESVQAGGGSVPGHQGGGIKLLIKIPTTNAYVPGYQKSAPGFPEK